jgi:type IV fimbrial biogenesis protein FimT
LLVTLAIIAIAMQIAVPGLVTFQRNAELTSSANNFVALLSNARSEAMSKGMGTVVVPADGASWSSGAISFLDVDRNSSASSSNNIQLSLQEALPSYLNTAGPASFKFDASGFSITNNGTISIARNDVTGAELLKQTRKVIVANTGRVRACTPISVSDTNC